MGIRTKPLGRGGAKIPELGIGTWKMGGSPERETDAIRKAISIGMGLVDTAEMYGNERLVGEAVRGRKAFLATKVSPHHFRHDDVIRACRESLSKLGVESIDLYQLHWPNRSVDIAETMSAMEELMDTGLIRAHRGEQLLGRGDAQGAGVDEALRDSLQPGRVQPAGA